jgi:UDP-3-O-[3-hydroxymyristoyl] glucosamine N-acyltransferase
MALAEHHNMEHFNLVHKDNYISKSVKLGKGNFIGQQNIIERDVTIGDFFICGYQNKIGRFYNRKELSFIRSIEYRWV